MLVSRTDVLALFMHRRVLCDSTCKLSVCYVSAWVLQKFPDEFEEQVPDARFTVLPYNQFTWSCIAGCSEECARLLLSDIEFLIWNSPAFLLRSNGYRGQVHVRLLPIQWRRKDMSLHPEVCSVMGDIGETWNILPRCSYFPWHDLFYKMLNYIVDLMTKNPSDDLLGFLQAAYRYPVPRGGEELHVIHKFQKVEFREWVPDAKRLPSIPENRVVTEYFNALDVHNMTTVFAR